MTQERESISVEIKSAMDHEFDWNEALTQEDRGSAWESATPSYKRTHRVWKAYTELVDALIDYQRKEL